MIKDNTKQGLVQIRSGRKRESHDESGVDSVESKFEMAVCTLGS
jgi:hypothetical protein